MHFKPAQCPSCGGSLQVPDDRTTVNCMYCGATIVVREAIHAAAAASLPNLLKLARAAVQSANHQEAYDYFTRALEIDANNSEAWAGKAEAAGRMSGHASFRMPEMINCFRNAIDVAGDDERAQIRDKAAPVICRTISEDYLKMRSALSPAFWESATWNFYLKRVEEIIKVLEDANKSIPDNPAIVKAIIWLCDHNSNRVSAVGTFGQPIRGPEFDSQWKAIINDKKRKYTEELHALNRPLTLPPITKEVPDSAITTVSTSNGAGMPNRNVLLIGLGVLLLIGLIVLQIALAVNQ